MLDELGGVSNETEQSVIRAQHIQSAGVERLVEAVRQIVQDAELETPVCAFSRRRVYAALSRHSSEE